MQPSSLVIQLTLGSVSESYSRDEIKEGVGIPMNALLMLGIYLSTFCPLAVCPDCPWLLALLYR